MTPLNPLFAIVIFAIAFLSGYLIHLVFPSKSEAGRYETIDGLRGFLALGVFIHHASIWHQYLKIENWEAPKSNLYNQFGQSSVSLFFMITSFLFVTKLLNTSSNSEFNWRRFFISRWYRLTPMYYISLVFLFILVFAATHWQFQTSFLEFLASLFHWGVFTITTAPKINNTDLTYLVNAGVIWSLPLEWWFYFSLPLLSLLILKVKPSRFYLGLSFVFVTGFCIVHGIKLEHLLSFAGGAIAPLLLKYKSIPEWVKSNSASILIVGCLFLIPQFETSADFVCKILIASIFTFIALGNSLFGLLKNSTLKFLGEMAYSTYLLHGMVLFTVFYFGIGIGKIKNYTAEEFCIVVFSMTPLVVLVSYLGYRFIELPFMIKGRKIK